MEATMSCMNHRSLLLATAVVLTAAGCPGPGPSIDEPLLPDVTQATFVAGVDNRYFPLPVGATWTFEAQVSEGVERVEIVVLADTKDVNGITAVQVQDTATLNGVLLEDTTDWYAQDSDGNVWYLGEDTCEYENDECVNREGTWAYGTDGALPGLVMPATPAVDELPYRQEFYPGHAEDVGEVIALGETVEVPAGTFTDCLRTHDTSTLDTTIDEQKLYCPGIGNVLAISGDGTREELIDTSLP